MTKQKKFILAENEIPTQWYNILADMPNKPLPPIHPATKQPLTWQDLAHIFPEECSKQELDMEHRWIDIPEEVLEKYKFYRSTPLVRAYELEKAIDTPAHIYFKNESTNPLGSHKINSALPQCYYAKQEGTTNVTTETGAGQWGAALSYAAKIFGLDCAVYQVKITMQQKPYRSSIMRTFGAAVTGSPSMSTRAGKDILTVDPTHPGSLGTAISEAVELATTTPKCKYVLGSVLNHVALHQSIIGLEAEKQMAMAGEYPDMVIACFGGGSNFGGIAFPFMRHNILDGKKTEFIAAEPDSCPKLTRGKFQYDFGDEAVEKLCRRSGKHFRADDIENRRTDGEEENDYQGETIPPQILEHLLDRALEVTRFLHGSPTTAGTTMRAARTTRGLRTGRLLALRTHACSPPPKSSLSESCERAISR